MYPNHVHPSRNYLHSNFLIAIVIVIAVTNNVLTVVTGQPPHHLPLDEPKSNPLPLVLGLKDDNALKPTQTLETSPMHKASSLGIKAPPFVPTLQAQLGIEITRRSPSTPTTTIDQPASYSPEPGPEADPLLLTPNPKNNNITTLPQTSKTKTPVHNPSSVGIEAPPSIPTLQTQLGIEIPRKSPSLSVFSPSSRKSIAYVEVHGKVYCYKCYNWTGPTEPHHKKTLPGAVVKATCRTSGGHEESGLGASSRNGQYMIGRITMPYGETYACKVGVYSAPRGSICRAPISHINREAQLLSAPIVYKDTSVFKAKPLAFAPIEPYDECRKHYHHGRSYSSPTNLT